MRFSLDKNGIRTHIDDADIDEPYYCPECGEQMVQRHGEIIAHCFAHRPNTQCIDKWQHDESDWHVRFQSLFPKENQEVVLESNAEKHFADVCFKDRKVVIEIQSDHLRQTEFVARNDFFRSLGYHIIWIFDETRVFENEAVEYGPRRKGCYRRWKRPSRTFTGFDPQREKDVEVWFVRTDEEMDNKPRFFRVTESDDSFRNMHCSFCHSLVELMRYLKGGEKTPDFSDIYDTKYVIKRSDGSESIYCCPKRRDVPFASARDCSDCPYKMEIKNYGIDKEVGCAYRIERMDWNVDGEIAQVEKTNDGFVNRIVLANEDGEVQLVDLDCPKCFLRNLSDLWSIYRGINIKYLVCFNVNTKRNWKVFNPDWQK
ncbi:MAG: hypothetical protein J6328_02145, partial [Bacilli bacterium]|nr:hypothetical protein [Bacilli bacterium]